MADAKLSALPELSSLTDADELYVHDAGEPDATGQKRITLQTLLQFAGSSGLHFRDPPDEFVGATLAACRTARDTYFNLAANATDKAEFAADRSLAIVLNPTSTTDNTLEVFTGAATDTSSNTNWLARTDAVQGNKGNMGNQGIWYARIFQNAATAPTTIPTGGSIAADNTITAPMGWVIASAIAAPAVGEDTYESISEIDPATDTFPLVPTWSHPFEIGGVGGAAAAAAAAASAAAAATSATEADTSATESDTSATAASGSASDAADSADEAADSAAAAAADAALVDSYTGPVKIVDAEAFTSFPGDVDVPNWRDYDQLAILLLDSASPGHSYQVFVLTVALDETGVAQVPAEQNFELEVTATDGNDSLSFDSGAGGASGFPSTGDTITIWGLRVGVQGGGGGGGGGTNRTNLALGTRTATTVQITSDTGTDATLPSASGTEAGLQSAADKTKLDATPAAAGIQQHYFLTGGTPNARTIDFAAIAGFTAAADGDAITFEVPSTWSYNGIQGLAINIGTVFIQVNGPDGAVFPAANASPGSFYYAVFGGLRWEIVGNGITVEEDGRYGGEMLFGAVDPVATDGLNRDTWLNTTDHTLWKKAAGAWTEEYSFPTSSSPDDHTRRIARSADTTLTEGEVTAGASSTTNTVTLPFWGQGVEEYIFVGVPENEADITDVEINSNSAFSGYQAYVDGSSDPIIVSGHKWWRTNQTQDGEFGYTADLIQ